MLNTLWGVVREKKIELLEKVNMPEGARVLVILLRCPQPRAQIEEGGGTHVW